MVNQNLRENYYRVDALAYVLLQKFKDETLPTDQRQAHVDRMYALVMANSVLHLELLTQIRETGE